MSLLKPEKKLRCRDCASITGGLGIGQRARECAACGSTNFDVLTEPARRVLVCGSRSWTDRNAIRERLLKLRDRDPIWDDPTIIHGDARGADKVAADVAARLGFDLEAYPANWMRYGKAAGPMRNIRMLDSGVDLVLAFQLDGSRGTQHTIDEARRRGIPVEVTRG